MNRFLILWTCMLLPAWSWLQNCGLPSSVSIPFADSIEIPLEVFDLVNDDLSDPGQGVCRVQMQFFHNEIGSFEVWLTSPAGQSVQLIGPKATNPVNGLFFYHDIEFIATGIGEIPTRFRWDNSNDNPSNFSYLGGMLTGSFYPYDGQLNDFNTGPVNGTWTLKMKSRNEIIEAAGTLRKVKIVFCDPLGENCCFADAGLLDTTALITLCEGDPAFAAFQPAPVFAADAPDSTEYAYMYALAQDTVLLGFDTLPDLSRLAPGAYQLAGLSYKRSDRDSLALLGGAMRLDTLDRRLMDPVPPFCGDLTDQLITIRVFPRPDTVVLDTAICDGDLLIVGDSAYAESGVYFQTLPGSGGCDSTVQVNLAIIPLDTIFRSDTICYGDTLFFAGYALASDSIYHLSLPTAAGCDSTVIFDLTVAAPALTVIDTTICSGQSVSIGTETFNTTGIHRVFYPYAAGCDSVVELRLTVLAPEAVYSGPDTLTISCAQPTVLLDGSASQPLGGVSFRWERRIGLFQVDLAGFDSVLVTGLPGTYYLQVSQAGGGKVCARRNSRPIIVLADTAAPAAQVLPPATLDCGNSVVDLQVDLASVQPHVSYGWTTVDGRFAGDTTGLQVAVDRPGPYGLVAIDTTNGCADTAFTVVAIDTLAPAIEAGPARMLTCALTELRLAGNAPAGAAGLRLQWTGPCLEADTTTLEPLISCPGTYFLEAIDTVNQCRAVDSVLVTLDPLRPQAITADTAWLDCTTGTALLDGSLSGGGVARWFRNGGLLADTAVVMVGDTGRYVLVVENDTLGCRDTAEVWVGADCRPQARIALPDTLTCTVESVVLDGSASAGPGLFAFQWVLPDSACAGSPADTSRLEVGCPGKYMLVVRNLAVGQSDTAEVEVVAAVDPPEAEVGPADTLTCNRPQATLSATIQGVSTTYYWANFRGDTLAVAADAAADEAGWYYLEVTDQRTGCRNRDSVEVAAGADLPVIQFGNTIFPCGKDAFLLQAVVAPEGDYRYAWSGPGLTGLPDTSAITVTLAGDYRLTAEQIATGCRVTRSVTIDTLQDCGICLDVPLPDTLSCVTDSVFLTADPCDTCQGCTYEWFYPDVSGTGILASPERTVNMPGVYTLLVRDTQGLVAAVEVEVFRDVAAPVVDAGPGGLLTCSSPEVDLQGSATGGSGGYAFRWQSVGAPAAIAGADQPIARVVTPGQYVLEATDLRNGCTALDSVAVAIDTMPPAAEAGDDLQLDCQSPLVRLSAAGSDQGPDFALQWTGATGGITTGATTANPLVQQAGVYYLTVTDTTNGCTATDSVRVVNAQAAPPLPMLRDTFFTCRDTQLVLGTGGMDTTGLDLFWAQVDAGGDTIGRAVGPQWSVSSPGVIFLTIKDRVTACESVGAFSVGLRRELPGVEAGAPMDLSCRDTRLELSGNTDASAFRAAWTGPAGALIENADSLKAVVADPGRYVLTITDLSNGCAASDSVLIGLDDRLPVVEAGRDTALTCSLTTLHLAARASAAGGPVELAWTTDTGNLLSGADQVDPEIGATGVYYLTATDPVNGCQATDSLVVSADTVRPSVRLDFQGIDLLTCKDGVVVLDAAASVPTDGSALNFSWKGADGSLLQSGDSLEAATFAATESGVYRVEVLHTANGCGSEAAIEVMENRTTPTVEPLEPGRLDCATDSVVLSLETMEDPGRFDYRWSLEGNLLPDGGSELIAYLPGAYSVEVIDTLTGCTAREIITLTEDRTVPVLNLAMPEVLDCDQNEVQIEVVTPEDQAALFFNWTTRNGRIVRELGGEGIVVDRTGLYFVEAENPENSCKVRDTVEVTANANAVRDLFLTVGPVGCREDIKGSIRIDSVAGGTSPFLFALNGGVFSAREQFGGLEAGVYVVAVEDINGCGFQDTVTLDAPLGIALELGPDQTVQLGDSIELKARIEGSVPYEVRWTPAGLRIDSTGERLLVRPLRSQVYSVTVTDELGCTATDQVWVRVVQSLPVYVPNAFSPDGDGQNDRFMVYTGGSIERVQVFRVFDRWGTLVFEQRDFQPDDPARGWDGAIGGTAAPGGVYVYALEVVLFDGTTRTMEGTVVLVR